MRKVFKYVLLLLVFMLLSTSLHEIVHLFQMEFKVDEICFFGFEYSGNFWNATAGWVVISNEEMIEKYEMNEGRYEREAEIIGAVIAFIILIPFIRKIEEKKI